MKKDEKNPFVSGTPEQVKEIENGYYSIQIGTDFYQHEGKMAFTRERAEKFYEDLIAGMQDMIANGTSEEKEDAIRCLTLVRMMPLRIN